MGVKVFKNPVAISCGSPKMFGYGSPMLFSEGKNAPCGVGCLSANLSNAGQEKIEPSLPVAPLAHRLEVFIVVLAMTLEVVRKVEHRLRKYLALAKQKSNQETAHTSIPIEEGMDCFKLGVNESNFDKQRKVIICVEKSLKIAEALGYLIGGRWNKARSGERTPA